MKINNQEVSIETAIKFADYDKLLLRHRKNNISLSDYQVDILNRNGIDFNNFTSVRELLFEIEKILDSEYDEELDNVSDQLAEFVYYNETKK